jgi:hypothetical protein
VRLLLVLLSVLVLLAGCSGGSGESAGSVASAEGPDDMLKRVLTRHFKGQYRLAYDDLHPAHQALVTRDNYAYCLSRVLTTADLRSVTTLKITDAPLTRDAIPEKQAKEVTLRVTAGSGNMRDSAAQSFRAVRTDGRWAWILPASDIGAYRAGRCPAA